MKKKIKKVSSVIAKGGKLLLRNPKPEKSFDESGEPIVSRQFVKMKKREEKKRRRKKNKKPGAPKALKIWDRNFGGSFHHVTKKTAEFIKKSKTASAGEKKRGRSDL